MNPIMTIQLSEETVQEQFVSELQQVAAIRERREGASGKVEMYDILPAFGSGCVHLYYLMNNVLLTIFDAVFHQELMTDYRIPACHFEIEYCVSGCLGVRVGDGPENIFGRNALSVSTSSEVSGRLRHIAGQRYKCVSLTADTRAIAAYLGSAGAPLWEDTFERLSRAKRSCYFAGMEASPDIAACFVQIFHCSLPEKMRILFFEGKFMEILSLVIADEAPAEPEESTLLLDEYEVEQIRQVPGLLAHNLFGLPTIAELSRRLAMNRNKLMWGFKQLYGDTIYGYHRRMCLRQAATLLLHTGAAIHEIALDVGYSNASNFCSAFKKEYGMTPLQYRLDAAKEKEQIAT